MNEVVDTATVQFAEGVEISGTVKWFNGSKGYGFIIPDDGSQEVLLHKEYLRLVGLASVSPGQKITVISVLDVKGPRAIRVVSIVPKEPPAEAVLATCTMYNEERGYGFVKCPSDCDDIFVHRKVLVRGGLDQLSPGQQVWVRYGREEKGLRATEVRSHPQ